MAKEECCQFGCPCEAEGVECHFEVCGCAKEGECGNREGRYKYDKKGVEECRGKFMGAAGSLFCEKC